MHTQITFNLTVNKRADDSAGIIAQFIDKLFARLFSFYIRALSPVLYTILI